MKILFEIGHPAHVHKFACTIKTLESNSHSVYVYAKNQALIFYLLKYYGIKYINAGEKKDSLFKKIRYQLKYDWDCLKICKKEKIDICVGSIAVAHVSKLLKIPSLLFDDDDDAVEPLMVKYAHPFFSTILSPEALLNTRKRQDTIYYSGYHELAYLHPKRFIPNPAILEAVKIEQGERYFIMRFTAFKAHHDIDVNGLSLDQKLQLVYLLKQYGKVFITTERNIEPELKEYQLPVAPEDAHHLMYYATMFIGDSQTMTSEAAVLGIPAFKCNTFAGKLSVPNELEYKYNLCHSFIPHDFDKMLIAIEDTLNSKTIKNIYQERRKKMLSDQINVTAFMVWFIENYPESKKIMKENPDYQYRFK